METEEKPIARLRVARGDYGCLHRETFEVPYQPGASILDGLIWIRENVDPTLAFRYSCINANVCRECIMIVDGQVAYACVERLHEGDICLAPIESKPHLRDLVCDTLPPKEGKAGRALGARDRPSMPL